MMAPGGSMLLIRPIRPRVAQPAAAAALRAGPIPTSTYLQAITDVAQVTVDGVDADEVFRRIARDARTLVGAASSTIGTLASDPTGLTIRAADGARAELLEAGSVVPVEGTLAAGVVRTGRTLVVPGPDAALEPYRSILVRFDLGPAICVPLVARGKVFGAMAVAHSPGSAPFRAAHVALVEAFAGQAAIALEFTRVRAELRRLAVVDERERIARELHDGTIQVLFGLGLELQVLETRLQGAIAPRLDAAVVRIDDVMQDLRKYIAGLRPSVLTRFSEWNSSTERVVVPQPQAASVATWTIEPTAATLPGRTRRGTSGRRGVEHRLRAVGEINQAILDGVGVDTVFIHLAHSARTLVDADSVIVGTLQGDARDGLMLRAIEGPLAERFRPGDLFQLEDTVLAEAVRTGRVFVAADTRQAAASFERTRQLGIRAGVAVPLAVRGKVFGALAVGRSAARPPFPPADVRLMSAFAAQAAIGLEYGRARDELNWLAVLGERERIARELHEGVIQTLFGVGMDLQALASALDDPTTYGRLSQAVDGIDSVIHDLRKYVFGLRPGILADRQVDRALRELAADFAQRTGITPALEIDVHIAARLVGAAATDVVQIAREALSNVARHAQATMCHVALRREDGAAVLEVSDDGSGVGTDLGQTSGQGLGNMRARAAARGGVLIVTEGLQGRGTGLRAIVPV
jgi:signal transduction histidine kinase